jgi:hypothetical protein
LCVAIGKARQAPDVRGNDLCPVYLRERMMRIITGVDSRAFAVAPGHFSTRLEIRGLHTCNDIRLTRNAGINFIEFQEKM